MNFKSGAKDGIAIALGYLSVSFTFGVLCVDKGFPVWFAPLVSLTNFTGTGQFAGVDLIFAGASLVELAVTMLIINIRYALMSISLSQRLSPKVKLWQRWLIAFGITDENFAVAVNKPREVTARYMAGLILTSFSGWLTGTVIGSFAGTLMPHSVLTAFGIALYAMFIAIIIPPSTKSLAVFVTVALAAALSCAFWFVPGLKALGSGWIIIICGVAAAIVATLLFPIKSGEHQTGDTTDGKKQIEILTDTTDCKEQREILTDTTDCKEQSEILTENEKVLNKGDSK